MAMSQFSYGKLEVMGAAGKKLPVPGGYDSSGNLTDEARDIMETGRVLPVGFWKGAGLSLVLDLLASILSGGKPAVDIGAQGAEYGVCQVFICLQPQLSSAADQVEKVIQQALTFVKSSQQVNAQSEILYPGEMVLRTRLENLEAGIPVHEEVWQQVQDYVLRGT